MKITFVGQADRGFSTNRIGGSETCFRRLAAALKIAGHEVDFIVYRQNKRQGYFINKGDSRFVDDVGGLKRIITELKTDIVNISPMIIRGELWKDLLHLKKNGVRISSIYWMYPVYNGTIVKKIRSAIFNKLVFDKVFGSSPRIINELRRWGSAAKLLNPPVDDQYYQLGLNRPLKQKIETIGYIGRIGSDKGIEWILSQDFDELKQRGIRFLLFGYYDPFDSFSVSLHKRLQRHPFIEYHSDNINTELSPISGILVDWLQQLDAVVFPYITLSGTIDIPLLCLEACAAGCRVYSPPVGDLKTVLKEQIIFFRHHQRLIDIMDMSKNTYLKPLNNIYSSHFIAHKFISTM